MGPLQTRCHSKGLTKGHVFEWNRSSNPLNRDGRGPEKPEAIEFCQQQKKLSYGMLWLQMALKNGVTVTGVTFPLYFTELWVPTCNDRPGAHILRIWWSEPMETPGPTSICKWFRGGKNRQTPNFGSEIRRSPVGVGSFYQIICRVLYIAGGCWGFLNHQK